MGVSPQQLNDFLAEAMPAAVDMGLACEDVGPGYAVVRLPFDRRWLRPGGYIRGPTLMTVADTALYFAVFGSVGIEPMAVTGDLSIRFLHPAVDGDLLGRCDLLKITDRVAYGEVRLFMAHEPRLVVAHATGSYVLPKGSRRRIR